MLGFRSEYLLSNRIYVWRKVDGSLSVCVSFYHFAVGWTLFEEEMQQKSLKVSEICR